MKKPINTGASIKKDSTKLNDKIDFTKTKNKFSIGMILSVLNANKGAIIGTFIAIGAYSKDSLFFQLIFPENKFSVNAQMAMVSPLNQGIGYVLNSDSTNSTKLMLPLT